MPQKRKILLLDTGKEWGGGTNSMLELLKRINRDKFDITCCFYSDYSRAEGQTIGQVLNSIGIPLLVIPQRKQPAWAKLLKEAGRGLLFFSRSARKAFTRHIDTLWRIRPNVSKIETIFREGGFDTLYMNNQPGSNEEGYLAGANLHARIIQHCRIEPVLTPPLVKLVNTHATKIIAVSHGVERVLLQHGVRPELCTTVNNAIDIHQPLPDRRAMRQRLNIDDDTFVFGSIGSLIPRKANHHTLEALAQFSQRHPQAKWKMVLVGEGAERGALAAMLLNIPVIGSKVTGTAELIDHESTGLLFPWSDVSQLAQHLDYIWQDPALRARLAAAAHQNVCNMYAIESYVNGVEAVLGAQ